MMFSFTESFFKGNVQLNALPNEKSACMRSENVNTFLYDMYSKTLTNIKFDGKEFKFYN